MRRTDPRGTRGSESPAAAARRPPRSRKRWRRPPCPPPGPRRRRSRSSPGGRRDGSTPPDRRTVSSTASSEGTPVTPMVLPARSAGVRISFGSLAITDASGRCTIAAIGTRSSPRSRAMPKSLMSITAKSARPVSSSLALSAVLDGSCMWRSMPSSLKSAVRLRGVDAGVDGVRLEVEDQGRALRRARFSAAPSAARRGRRSGRRPPAARRPVSFAADPIPKASIKVCAGVSARPEIRLDCAPPRTGGAFFYDGYEEVTSSARSRSSGVYR